MIKSVVSNESYPKLMVCINGTGLVVLFDRPQIGVVVASDGTWGVGHNAEDWVMSSFTGFTGSITLSNGNE